MKKGVYTILITFLGTFLWSCGSDDVSEYTKEEYSTKDKLAFEKKRDSVLFYQYKADMTNLATMYAQTVPYEECLKVNDEIKAELKSKTGTFYSVNVNFSRLIEDKGLKLLAEEKYPYFVIFTRKTLTAMVSQDVLASNELHANVNEFIKSDEINALLTTKKINNPVSPIFSASTHTDNIYYNQKVRGALSEVSGTEYIFVLTQLYNTVPTTSNAGNYYGMVTVVNTYQNKIVANFPVAFLYQELSDLEGEMQKNIGTYLKKAMNVK